MTDQRASLGRRDFIKSVTVLIGAFIGTLIAVPGVAALISPGVGETQTESWINLGALNAFALGIPTLREFTRTKLNGWERTAMAYGVFVVRTDAGSVRVFSNICTHLGCHVNWHADVGHYISPCHDGHFDIMGRNVSGPPPRPLDEFETQVREDNLYIRLPAFKRPS